MATGLIGVVLTLALLPSGAPSYLNRLQGEWAKKWPGWHISVPFNADWSIEGVTGWKHAETVAPTPSGSGQLQNVLSGDQREEGRLELDVFREVLLESSETLALAVSATITVANGRSELCSSGQVWASVGPTYPSDSLGRLKDPRCFEVRIVRDAQCQSLPLAGLRLIKDVVETWRAKALMGQTNITRPTNDGPVWAVRMRLIRSGLAPRLEQYWVVQCDGRSRIDSRLAWPIGNSILRRVFSTFELLRPIRFECLRPYSKNHW